MAYDKNFRSGRQRIRSVGNMVIIEGLVQGDLMKESIAFDADRFVSVTLRQGGKVCISTEQESSEISFGGGICEIAFTSDDILEAVAAAKTEV